MTEMFTTKAAGKFLTWIFGKDSTAIATWATLGLGWVFYQYVYKPERAEERKARVEEAVKVAAENAKAIAEVRAMSDAATKSCESDKDRLYKAQDALMQRMDRILDQRSRMAEGVAATASPDPDCP